MKIKREVITYMNDDVEFDGLTLLSKEEYNKYQDGIKPVNFWWWLRSPGGDSYCASFVYGDGSLDRSYVSYASGSVRPALILKSNNLLIGDRFNFYNYNWTVISDQYALCDEAFCEMEFREKWNAENANDYKYSDVKKYLDEQWRKMKDED